MFSSIGRKYQETALIKLIAIGLVLGIIVAVALPQVVPAISILGDLFVKALKGVAPVLVFVLVMNAMAQKNADASASMRPIVRLYIISTFLASMVAVSYSFLFPTTLRMRWCRTSTLPLGGDTSDEATARGSGVGTRNEKLTATIEARQGRMI